MLGFWGQVYAFLARQVGLRTDAADPDGSLHAKVSNLIQEPWTATMVHDGSLASGASVVVDEPGLYAACAQYDELECHMYIGGTWYAFRKDKDGVYSTEHQSWECIVGKPNKIRFRNAGAGSMNVGVIRLA